MIVNPCVVLDANMSIDDVISRLARQGYWLYSSHPLVQNILEQSARRLKLPLEEVTEVLARPFTHVGAAIRRQWYANILWYARPLIEVLPACYQAPVGATLLTALNLAEDDSKPPIAPPPPGEVPQQEGVIVEGGSPIAVSIDNWGAPPPDDIHREQSTRSDLPTGDIGTGDLMSLSGTHSRSSISSGSTAVDKPHDVHAWPRIEAPSYIPAGKPFDVVIGLALSQQHDVSGDQMVFHPPIGTNRFDIEVALISEGVDAIDGWVKSMSVDINNPAAAHVTFRLVGQDPSGPEPVHLTMLEVHYSYAGSVCGLASRPMVIGQADSHTPDLPDNFGTSWLSQPQTMSSLDVQSDPDVADLTIEIFKPDGNPAKGSYICHLYSPHDLKCEMGPFRIELDDDAKSFAYAIVREIRAYSNSPAVENLLESHGEKIADKLGPGVMTALRDVARLTAPAVPAVLLVSADPYVPWELAIVDPPLDPNRPKFLGAQTILGRWLRDRNASTQTSIPNDGSSIKLVKPPMQPPSHINVKHMAVMAGMYLSDSGLPRLQEAEREAQMLQKTYDAIPLAASLQAIKQLLDAHLEHNFKSIGGVETIHFAGHGEYDVSNPDSAVLYLSDGKPLFASLFRSAKYGGPQSPMFFLNACMAGIGNELLGDMGGFPGNCLKGGFGGILGALWEIDDAIAHKVAIEFWQRALPTGGTAAEPVGVILRDIRRKYASEHSGVPASTYLAYVYYGHPRLTLQMVN